jgi:hypothetical protein
VGRGFLVLVVVVLLTPACGGAPSASACAQEWNRSDNRSNQQEAASSGLEQAIVYGWTVKSGDRGCSVTLIRGPGQPWITYSRLIDPPNESGRWDSVDGMRWGADNPQGGRTQVNASLQPDGLVGLE